MSAKTIEKMFLLSFDFLLLKLETNYMRISLN